MKSHANISQLSAALPQRSDSSGGRWRGGPSSSSKPIPKPPIWVSATGTWKTRVKKARYYLCQTAWVPTSPEQQTNALFIVVCNLRRYFRLQGPFAATLVQEHYAPKLASRVPEFKPWTDADILEKYRLAGKRGMYPTLGVSDPRAKKKAEKLALHKEVRAFVKRYVVPGGSCTPKALRDAFIAYRGGAIVNDNAFGRAVVAITGIKSCTPFGKRTYRDFQLSEAAKGLTTDVLPKSRPRKVGVLGLKGSRWESRREA